MTGKNIIVLKILVQNKVTDRKKILCIRDHRVLSLTGFLSFNRQDHRGIGDGDLLSKELVCVV